jgi:hypothetical protein
MKALVYTIFLVMLCVAAPAQPKARRSPEQRSFGVGMDRPVVRNPVVLSNADVAVLAKDELVRRELDQDPPITKLTRDGLEAAVVHLHGPKERDLLVVGSGRPFIGANVGPFWVIRELPTGPQVVLAAISLSLEIRKTRSNGYRDIELFAATAVEGTTTKLHFNGTKYVLYRQTTAPIGQ